MKRLVDLFVADTWTPVTLDHIADVPMTFETKSSLRSYCREKGLVSGVIEDVRER
jgi:hypothetical protein